MPSPPRAVVALAAAVAVALALAPIAAPLAAGHAPADGGGAEQAPDPNATVWVGADHVGAHLDDAADVRNATRDGRLVRTEPEDPGDPRPLTLNDTLVLSLSVPGLNESLADQPGANATARMRALVAGGNASLSTVQQNPTPERLAMRTDLLGSDATRVVPGEGDTAYLVVAVNELTVYYDEDRENSEPLPDGPYYDAVFRTNFTLDGESAVAEFRTREVEVGVLTPPGSDAAFVPPNESATVTGRTNAAPGTYLRVEVYRDLTNERIAVRRVQVGPDGRFSVPVDTGGLPNGTDLSLAPALGTREFDHQPVTVVRERASVAFADQVANGRYVEVSSVSLSYGGLVVVRNESGEGPVVATELLAVGDHSDVVFEFDDRRESNETLVATLYRDADHDGAFDPAVDDPYGVSATANYTYEPVNPDTDTPTTTTETPTPWDKNSPDETPTPTETTETVEPVPEPTTNSPTETPAQPTTIPDSGPGFGAVLGLAAMAALAAAALVAVRRD